MEGLASYAANQNIGSYKGTSKTIKAKGPKRKCNKRKNKENLRIRKV